MRKGKKEKSAIGEMSFIDHIEELRWHIIRSLIAVFVCGIIAFFNVSTIYHEIILGPAHADFASYKVLCRFGEMIHIKELCLQEVNLDFQNIKLSGQFMMSFSIAFMVGLIVAFPYIMWELWRFLKPALTTNEKKGARGIVFWTSLLFFLGVLFAYFIVAPFTINFFANYKLSPDINNIITMSNYYDTLNELILGIGLVFELPVLVYFLSKVGVITPELMRSKRSYAILIIFVLSAVITPPDWFSIFLVAVPLLLLYQLSISISARAVKARNKRLNKLK